MAHPQASALSTTAPTAEAAPFDPHFLVISLGNPPPYAETFHSAGHHVLQSLQKQIQASHDQPPFSSERMGKSATQASRGNKYTLLQCPTFMNISGPWVAKVWKELCKDMLLAQRPLGVIIVHDDLEQDMGAVKTRKWDTSPRGHNGLKSINESIRPTDQANAPTPSKWAKICVGIGRPQDRDHGTVQDYVLRPMSKFQKDLVATKSAGPVLAALTDIQAAWEKETVSGSKEKKATRPATATRSRPTRN